MSNLAKNIIDYMFGSSISKLIHVGVFLWLADRIGPEHFGQFSVFVSSLLLITLLLSLNLHGGISRYFYEEYNEQKSFLNTIVLAIAFLFLIWLAAAFVFKEIFYDFLSYVLITSAGLAIFSEIVSSAYIQVAQSKKQSRKIAIFQVLRFSSMGIAIYIATRFFGSDDPLTSVILFYSLGMFIPSFIVFTFYIIVSFKIKPDSKHLIYAAKYSIPMAIYVLSNLSLLHSDRIMISKIIGYDAAGVYSYAATIAMLILLIINTVLGAWTPYYFELMNSKNYAEVETQSERILVICGVAALLISSVLSVAFHYVLPADYMAAVPLFCFMVLTYYLALVWQLYGRHLGYFKLTPYVALIGFLTFLLNISLNWFLINIFGSMGAIAATAISYLFMVIIAYYLTEKLLNLVIVELSFLPKILIFFVLYILIELNLNSVLGLFAPLGIMILNLGLAAIFYWSLGDHAWVRNYLSKIIKKGAG